MDQLQKLHTSKIKVSREIFEAKYRSRDKKSRLAKVSNIHNKQPARYKIRSIVE